MAKFCGKCGSTLDDITGLCPKCNSEMKNNLAQFNHESATNKQITNGADNPKPLSKKEMKAAKKTAKKQTKKDKKKAKRAAMSIGQKIKRFFLKLLLVICLLAILAAGVIGLLVYYDVVDIPVINNLLISTGLKQEEPEEKKPSNQNDTGDKDDPSTNGDSGSSSYEVTPPDADSYFKNNSKIISELDINDSNEVHTESETYKNLSDRGFTGNPITTEYSMQGEYFKATDISNSSSSKHPIYQTHYVSQNGDVWTIFEINGTVIANPVSYNAQSELDVMVVISESDSVTSYDSTTNKFYETTPEKSSLIVKKISKIDSQTIESLTIGAIDAL